jgi:hypothetical protein
MLVADCCDASVVGHWADDLSIGQELSKVQCAVVSLIILSEGDSVQPSISAIASAIADEAR